MSVYDINIESREEKILKYLPLVKFIAGRIMVKKIPYLDIDDIYQYGVIGLIDAIDRYDPLRGVKFETYASIRIRGEIIDEIRRQSWVPRSVVEKITRLNEKREQLKATLNRDPSDAELAYSLDISLEELRKSEGYVNYLSLVSLEDVIYESDDEEFLYSVVENESSPKPDVILEEKEKLEILKKSIDMLDEKDRILLNLYYNEKLTLKEIGKILKVSESRVCQLHSRAILRLRANIKKLNY